MSLEKKHQLKEKNSFLEGQKILKS